jgi:hypothetical protein
MSQANSPQNTMRDDRHGRKNQFYNGVAMHIYAYYFSGMFMYIYAYYFFNGMVMHAYASDKTQ